MTQAAREQEHRKQLRRRMKESALSRFGLEAGKIVRQTLMQRVHKGDVKYARKLTRSRTVIVLEYAGRDMAFIYSNTSGEILTFLAPDAPETAAWRTSRSSRSTAPTLFAQAELAP